MVCCFQTQTHKLTHTHTLKNMVLPTKLMKSFITLTYPTAIYLFPLEKDSHLLLTWDFTVQQQKKHL